MRFHRVGTPQSDDLLVHRQSDHPDWSFDVWVTDDGRYLIVTTRKADDEHFRVAYKDLARENAELVELIDHFDNQYFFAGSEGQTFYFVTDRQSPQQAGRHRHAQTASRRVESDRARVERDAASAMLVGGQLLAVSMRDASTRVRAFRPDGTPVRDVELPGIGTAVGFEGAQPTRRRFICFRISSLRQRHIATTSTRAAARRFGSYS